jgi:hypothetical protein
MIRSTLLTAATITASVVMAACSDTTPTAPQHQIGDPAILVTSSPRSGALHLIAECSQYTRLAGSFCTFTFSSVKEVEVGSRVVYASAAGATSLNSDVALGPPGAGNDAAFGHCDLDLAAGYGQCTIWGGEGTLSGFRASAVAAHAGGNIWYWDGTYSFAQ